jgi:uncharacterized protein
VNVHLLVMAKAPVAGRVKTRLCPPCTHREAAGLAAAALADTLDAGAGSRAATHRTVVLSGRYAPPDGWSVLPQRGNGLAQRLSNTYADVTRGATVLIGMDTPQVTAGDLDAAAAALDHADAAIGPAVDGGWWVLALRDPAHGAVLSGVPMSAPDTAERTLAALRARGLVVGLLPVCRDVDTAADARAVAALAPASRFARGVRELKI